MACQCLTTINSYLTCGHAVTTTTSSISSSCSGHCVSDSNTSLYEHTIACPKCDSPVPKDELTINFEGNALDNQLPAPKGLIESLVHTDLDVGTVGEGAQDAAKKSEEKTKYLKNLIATLSFIGPIEETFRHLENVMKKRHEHIWDVKAKQCIVNVGKFAELGEEEAVNALMKNFYDRGAVMNGQIQGQLEVAKKNIKRISEKGVESMLRVLEKSGI